MFRSLFCGSIFFININEATYDIARYAEIIKAYFPAATTFLYATFEIGFSIPNSIVSDFRPYRCFPGTIRDLNARRREIPPVLKAPIEANSIFGRCRVSTPIDRAASIASLCFKQSDRRELSGI